MNHIIKYIALVCGDKYGSSFDHVWSTVPPSIKSHKQFRHVLQPRGGKEREYV